MNYTYYWLLEGHQSGRWEKKKVEITGPPKVWVEIKHLSMWGEIVDTPKFMTMMMNKQV